jgi:uncharacterized membrane protein YfcA
MILAFIAEILGTVSGFGSSILFIPLASLFFDFKLVLGITAVFHVFSNTSKIFLFRKGVNKNIVLKLGLPAVIAVIAGAFITAYIHTATIELMMNFILVKLAIYLIINFQKTIKQSDRNLYAGGLISGFIAGILRTGGAIRGLTLSAFQLSKEAFVSTSAIIDLGVDVSRAIVYLSYGYFDKSYYFLIPFLLFLSISGSFIGKLILAKTSEVMFRYIVLVVIVATAFYQIFRYFYQS